MDTKYLKKNQRYRQVVHMEKDNAILVLDIKLFIDNMDYKCLLVKKHESRNYITVGRDQMKL